MKEDEVEVLRGHAPELRALLSADHPAAKIARNLYRLSRLLKVPDSAAMRTEAALARHWWKTADGTPNAEVRAAQRNLSDLAVNALSGQNILELRDDSAARTHLLCSLTLRETKRDHLVFYHDVLRDWAVAHYIYEDQRRLGGLDMSVQVSPRLARGIELAGRLALEFNDKGDMWLELLTVLSPPGCHGSWRRQALMAMVRSERSQGLLERHGDLLLAQGGALFRDLCTGVITQETSVAADVFKGLKQGDTEIDIPRSLRIDGTGSALKLLVWCASVAVRIPLQAIGAVLDLVEIQIFALMAPSPLARAIARMLFGWLLQLDVHDAERTIPSDEDAERLDREGYSRLVDNLRMWSLLHAAHAPDDAKAYLRAVRPRLDHFKIKAIRPLSKSLAPVGPDELAALVSESLAEPEERTSTRNRPRHRVFSFEDSDYLPPSPAQPPFLDLLEAAPEVGLRLIRQLTERAVIFHLGRSDPRTDGFKLEFESGSRFFPWSQTYFWSRDQAHEYSVASGLKALEAWGHSRLDAGEPVDAVIADVLGPEGSCAAFLLVAVDLLLSHWPASRETLVPFIACPELLATERDRQIHDHINRQSLAVGREPTGKVRLADLACRPSRSIALEQAVVGYLGHDPVADQLRTRLKTAVEALGSYEDDANFGDPAFMGAYACNLLNPDNWVAVEGDKAYRSPPDEARHLERLGERSSQLSNSHETEAKIHLAVNDAGRGSPEIAREAVEYAKGDLPDGTDTDALKTRSTRLISTAMLVARDGDDALLEAHETWVRAVIDLTLAESIDRYDWSDKLLQFNRPALAELALIHLWRRRHQAVDRNALIASAIRADGSAPVAFAAGRDAILETDPRVLKAAMRAAFVSCRWRWHPWDEDACEQERYDREKAAADLQAVVAEMAWLDGGAEPKWPDFPEERPTLRRPLRIQMPSEDDEDVGLVIPPFARNNNPVVHVNSQAADRWLQLLPGNPEASIDWQGEIVDVYAGWSAKLNGHGLPPEAEINGRNNEWNVQFYSLLAIAAMDMPEQRFKDEMALVTGLPDKAFGDVAETLLHAADVTYFNNPQRPADRAVELRKLIVQRTMALRRWGWRRETSDLSMDYDTGGVTAKLFMNSHDPFHGTKTYLVPAVFNRIDPLLEALRPLLPGGPTSFVALCVMNMLLVAPRASHLDFLLAAAEAWLAKSNGDRTMWLELRIGQKVVEWCEKASLDEPGLLGAGHPLRARIETLLGRLVDLGVAEAHEFEKRLGQA